MPNILFKSTLRQPIHALLLFLLVSSISFVFISRTAEYLTIQRETERLGDYYRSIGSLVPLDTEDYAVDVSEGAELIEQSPYFAFEDKRRYSSGVLKGIYNADVDGAMADLKSYWTGTPVFFGINNSDVFFYGELTEKSEESVYRFIPEDVLVGHPLFFKVDTVVAGYPEYIRENKKVRVIVSPDLEVIDSMEIGQRYFIRAWFEPNSITIKWQMASQNLQMKPLTDEGLKFLIVPFDEVIDFSSSDLNTLRNEIEIVQENQHAMSVIATVDMSALPLMQESAHWYYLTEGRWINHEDNLNANKVCVVREEFADMRGITMRDTISLKLRSLQERGEYIRNGPDRENWQNYPTSELTCEIVGLYSQVKHQITAEFNDIYMPNSVFNAPSQESDFTTPSFSYSFVLKSSRDEEMFIQENQQALADLGFKIVFVDNKSGEFWDAVEPLRRSALTSFFIFSGVLVIALVLAVFLYLRQRQRDFAILRALGVPKRIAVLQILFPIGLVGGLGIISGGSVSWRYSLNKAAETLSILPTPAGEMPSASLHLFWLVGLCVGIIALLFIFARIGASFITHQPVLVLLQGNTMWIWKRMKPDREATSIVSKYSERQVKVVTFEENENYPAEALPISQRKGERKGNFPGLIRYQSRHLFRSGLKSILILLVALGFILALGWMQWTIEQNTTEVDHLYNTIVVDAQIVKKNASIITTSDYGFINRSIVEKILETGFINKAYLEAVSERSSVGKMDEATFEIVPYEQIDGLSLLAFDQPENFFSLQDRDEYLPANYTITNIEFAPGWDEGLFTEIWTEEMLENSSVPAIFPTILLHMLELEYGDVVFITARNGTARLLVAGQYIGGGGFSEDIVLIPLSALDVMDGRYLGYSLAQFELYPSKNYELPTFRQEVETLVEEPISGQIPLRVVIWDEELRSVVTPLEKNLSLMAILYPITVVLSVLIAIGLNFLLVIQNAKNAAILRVLGTTKLKVRVLFGSEQVLLSLIGLALGLGGLAILRRDPGAAFSDPALLSAGLYLAGALMGSLIGATLITRQKPLELLQVKE